MKKEVENPALYCLFHYTICLINGDEDPEAGPSLTTCNSLCTIPGYFPTDKKNTNITDNTNKAIISVASYVLEHSSISSLMKP